MPKEINEQVSQADEKKEQVINMETILNNSILPDDKGQLLENKKDSCDSSISKTWLENNTDIKENYNGGKDTILDGGFETNTKIDNQNDIIEDKEKKNTEENDKKEKDDYENKQLTEIDYIDIEDSVEDVEDNSFVEIDDESDDNTKVESKPLENTNLKENDHGEKENNFTDEKIKIDKNEEKFVDHNADELKINLSNDKMDSMPKDDEQKCENDTKNQIDDSITIIKVNQNENQVEEKNAENKADIKENNDEKKTKSLNEDFEENSKVDEQNINDNEIKNNTAENDEEMAAQIINKLKEIDNVSDIENHSKNDISVRMDTENDDNTKVVGKPLENAHPKDVNNGEKENIFTDNENYKTNENEEKLADHHADELRINVIEDYMNPIPKDNGMNLVEGNHNSEEHVQEKTKSKIENEEKLEDPEAVQREINLDEGNDKLNEDVKEKRKDDIGKEEEQVNKVADDQGKDLIDNYMDLIPNDGTQESKHNEIYGSGEEKINLLQDNDDLEENILKKRKNENEKNPGNHEQEVDNDDPGNYIHKKRKII